MLSFINNLVDRCFFTFSFIIGVQLPNFLQQYKQRLAGHLDEATIQLQEFKNIADQHFDGSLVTMIHRYKNNTESSIVSTGELIEQLTLRVEYLSAHLAQITSNDLINNTYHFLLNRDNQVVSATARDFVMAIPLELQAITSGAVLAVGLLIIKELCTALCKLPFKQPKNQLLD